MPGTSKQQVSPRRFAPSRNDNEEIEAFHGSIKFVERQREGWVFVGRSPKATRFFPRQIRSRGSCLRPPGAHENAQDRSCRRRDGLRQLQLAGRRIQPQRAALGGNFLTCPSTGARDPLFSARRGVARSGKRLRGSGNVVRNIRLYDACEPDAKALDDPEVCAS